MAVFPNIDKGRVLSAATSIAHNLGAALEQAGDFQTFLLATADADLVALGFSSSEVSTMKSAFTDMEQLHQVFLGNATRTPAYDYRTFVKLIWTFGPAV